MTRRAFVKLSQLLFAFLIFGGLRAPLVAALQSQKPTAPHHSYNEWMNLLQQPDETRQPAYAKIANAMISQSPAHHSTFNLLMEHVARPEAIADSTIPYTQILSGIKASSSDQTTFLQLMKPAHE